MKRRTITPEQKARSEARKAAFRALAKRVAGMTEQERTDLSRKCSPVSIAGTSFSTTNSILLILQCPTGTIFGGFRQWIKAGRCVRKGEHGAAIWCKTGNKENAAGSESAEPSGDSEGDSLRFIVGTVFDVSQTEALIPGDRNPGAPIIDTDAIEAPNRLELPEPANAEQETVCVTPAGINPYEYPANGLTRSQEIDRRHPKTTNLELF